MGITFKLVNCKKINYYLRWKASYWFFCNPALAICRCFIIPLSGCGGEKIVASDGTIGTITSPYYPNMYGKEDCVWDLRADSSEDRIELSFTDFDIEYDDDCSNYYLKVSWFS